MHAHDVRQVVLRHADPVGAGDMKLTRLEKACRWPALISRAVAEQAVAVDDRPRRMGAAVGDGAARDVDDERRRGGAVLQRHAVGVEVELRRRRGACMNSGTVNVPRTRRRMLLVDVLLDRRRPSKGGAPGAVGGEALVAHRKGARGQRLACWR